MPSMPKDPVRVAVARTGGFAGVMDTITVDTDGSWTHPTGVTTSGRLDGWLFVKLQQLTKDQRLRAEAQVTAPPTTCRDAFDYVVTAGDATVRYTDCPGDTFQPAVAKQIADLLEDAVS